VAVSPLGSGDGGLGTSDIWIHCRFGRLPAQIGVCLRARAKDRLTPHHVELAVIGDGSGGANGMLECERVISGRLVQWGRSRQSELCQRVPALARRQDRTER
jgi:hypothetical protein